MRMNKYLTRKKLIFVTLTVFVLSCIFFFYSVCGKRAEGYGSVDTSTTVSESLYSFDDFCYSQTALDDLSRQIMNAINKGSTRDLDDLIRFAKSEAGNKGQAIGGNATITLRYGRYRFTGNGSYRDFVWMPVYISRSTSGDAILTLYLSATEGANGSTSQQEAGTFSHDGLYSSVQSCAAPSNSYGTSHMRTVSLGNAYTNGAKSQYASYDENHTNYSRLYPATLKESNYNKFTDFVKGEDFTGTFYEDIATPSELEWQADESYAEYINEDPYLDYAWPNESYSNPKSGNYYQPTFFDYNATNKTNYNVWQYDKVWLPSLTEVGTGDIDGNGVDTTNGVWKLTADKRSNKISSWLRTANTTVPKTGDYSTYTMFAMDKDGHVTNADVNEKCAIRPAIHLNLSKISEKTTAPVNLPEVVKSVYNGDFQNIATIPAEESKWYSEEDMIVSFYSDENCINGIAPINAGEYYIRVELRSNSMRHFKGEDPSVRVKITKFAVEKVQLDVEWTYASEDRFAEPTDVKIVGEFYERDIKANNVPTVGMKYSNITNAGIQNSPVYPDKIGWYTAKAYIIDEEIRNFNYELSSDSFTSHQFEVLQKRIPEPYFVENNSTMLSLSYKGKQYIQIANISSYVQVNYEVTGVSGSDSREEAYAKIEDMGVVDGVQTFAVESVAAYRFTISLKDTINTIWDKAGTVVDVSEKRLSLSVNKAEITLTFEGLPSSWERARRVEFEVKILGVYNPDDKIELFVGYVQGSSQRVNITPENGKYVLKSNSLAVGDYYISAGLQGSSNSNYYIDSIKYGAGAVTQKFSVKATVPNFGPEKVVWQYKHNGITTGNYGFDKYSNPNTPLELENTGKYYEFALSLSATVLSGSPYYVKAIYSGDTYVKDAGNHSVTVTISAYDRNIEFESQTYTIYFRIKMAKFDLSSLAWSYTSPFVYSGSEYKVSLVFPTAAAGAADPFAGLTVVYKTDGADGNGAINAGKHTTTVTFIMSDVAKANYMLPDAADPESYIYNGEGSPFKIEWEIEKQAIEAEWFEESPSGDVFFIPFLKLGHNFVTYTYEHFVDGSWVSCSNIVSTSGTEKYRVTATLKSAHAVNYTLTGENKCEFEIAAGQFAVSTHIEFNGNKSESGAKTTYDGNEVSITPVVDSGEISINSYTVKYYPLSANGALGAELPGAPKNAGRYAAVITCYFSVNGVTYENETEFEFEIEKADVDLSAIRWTYTHGNTSMSVRFDSDQKKWIDDDGKEANYAFQYDGTEHRITLTGYENVAGLTFQNVANVAKTAVGNYTASISWYEDTANYNELTVPKTFNWSVVPATLDFSDVKWGYIDEDGNEHEFESDECKFTFTRDDDKNAIPFTVGLINLPEQIKSLFQYSTRSLTDKDFGSGSGGVVQGNSFAAVGEYHTEVSVVGSYTDPSGNYQDFGQKDFPSNISPFIDWEIAARDLSTPSYDNSWVVFDDKIHNLIEMSGVPEDQLNYYSVEITFIDNSNTIHNYYEGYAADGENPVEYTAHDAGRYIVRFYELVGDTNVAGYIVAQIEIDVAQEKLEVVWDRNGSIPVARVKGIYASDMIGTKYYIVKDGNRGAEVDLAYITSTNGDVTFEAEPFVTDKYANNLDFEMANGEVRIFTFEYEQFIPDGSSVQLDYPSMENAQIEYTGSAITFKIAIWDSYYSNYLYISDGELTQTEVGVYHVKVSFIKDANAYWSGTDGDRSFYDLTFEITKPTKQPLDYPVFNQYSVTYTGSPILFTITNWVVLQEYVEFEVFHNGKSLGTSETIHELRYTEAGIYSVVFKIKSGSIGVWIEDPDNPKKDYTVQFRIVDPNADDQEILTPTLQSSSKEYTGNALEFRVDNWSDDLEIVKLPEGVAFSGGMFTATEIGNYKITVRIKTAGLKFADGETTCELSFSVTPPSDITVTVRLPKPQLEDSSKPLESGKAEFRISGWESMKYGSYLRLTASDASVTVSGGVITAVKAGAYKITVSFKDGVNAEWQTGGTGSFDLTITVTEQEAPPEAQKLPFPVMAKEELEFTGKDITFEIKNWEVLKEYLSITGSLVQKDIGTYSVTVSLRDSKKAVWEDGTTEGITLSFKIKSATLDVTTGEDGAPSIKNGDDVPVDGILEEFFDKEYYDPDTGELVPEDQLEDGKNYDVKYKFKPDKKDEFEQKVENAGDVINTIEGNTYNITYHKPAGINWLLIGIIAGAVVLAIVILAVIIAVARRRRSDDYDYGGYDGGSYDYDEYDEYEEYDYEEDDEYDDYDDYDDDEY